MSTDREIFKEGWLKEQINSANKQINSWNNTKKQVMLRPDLDECEICSFSSRVCELGTKSCTKVHGALLER